MIQHFEDPQDPFRFRDIDPERSNRDFTPTAEEYTQPPATHSILTGLKARETPNSLVESFGAKASVSYSFDTLGEHTHCFGHSSASKSVLDTV